MDEHVPSAITEALVRLGVDVFTVQEDQREGSKDIALLERAMQLGRIIFSRDKDFLRICASLQRSRTHFAGVIYAHQVFVSIGTCIRDLELLSMAGDPEDFSDRVYRLPF
jgi:hypothetical protein